MWTSMSATLPTSNNMMLPPFTSPFGLPLVSVLSKHPLGSFQHWFHNCLLPLPTVHCFPEAAHCSHLFCSRLGHSTSMKSITHEPVQWPLMSHPLLNESYELRPMDCVLSTTDIWVFKSTRGPLSSTLWAADPLPSLLAESSGLRLVPDPVCTIWVPVLVSSSFSQVTSTLYCSRPSRMTHASFCRWPKSCSSSL